jgi:hypothetical protein
MLDGHFHRLIHRLSHRLKYFLPALCLVLQLAPLVPAQTNLPSNLPPARKLDEFGDVAASDIIARLDNFAVHLQNEPAARGFIIVYRARRDLSGLSNRYARRMKGYLVESRALSPERIVTVDGGITECLTQELWIVPFGATPQPRAEVYPNSFADAAYKFDEHYYQLPSKTETEIGYWQAAPDNLHPYLEAFALALQREPRTNGYLVAYKAAQFDRPNIAQRMLRRERDFLIKQYGIKPARIKTIDGGYRKWRVMELWVVPHGEYDPFASPARIAKSRRRR